MKKSKEEVQNEEKGEEIKIGDIVKLKGNPFDEQIPEELELYNRLKDRTQKVIDVKDVSKLEGTTGLWIKTNLIYDWTDKVWFEKVITPTQPEKEWKEEEVAIVINNNQEGWTNLVETAPNTTLILGTKLYSQEQVQSLLSQKDKEVCDKIDQLKNYYNTIGDERNKGIHFACDKIKELLKWNQQ